MEARINDWNRSRQRLSRGLVYLIIACGFTATGWFAPQPILAQRMFKVDTTNFVIVAPDPNLAKQVAENAERFRKELSIEWLGHEIGPWPDRCPIKVELARHAGGETSFAFVRDTPNQSKGIPRDWQMKIYGPPDRIVDSVLPHEITHTIFATHFGQPLPRWADEGACTTVEHASERAKNHHLLHEFLLARPSRGIPFNRMFTMRQYPRDILPLYAQGHSLAKFLIMKKGKHEFVNYISAGLAAERQMEPTAAWGRVTEQYFGYKDLSDLQIGWLGWVRDGSKKLESSNQLIANNRPSAPPLTKGNALLANTSKNAVENSVANTALANSGPSNEPVIRIPFESLAPSTTGEASVALVDSNADGWYVRQMQVGKTGRVAARRQATDEKPGLSEWQPANEPSEPSESAVEFTAPAQRLKKSELPTPFGGGTIWR